MAHAIRFSEPGAPDVLELQAVDDLAPGPGEVWLEQEAIGVNYLDITQRKGAVPVPLPRGTRAFAGRARAGRCGSGGAGGGRGEQCRPR